MLLVSHVRSKTHLFGHIASPDVLVDHDRQEIIMYFHGAHDRPQQSTAMATSTTGLDFTVRTEDLAHPKPYTRVFEYNNKFYLMAKHDSGITAGWSFWASKDIKGPFTSKPAATIDAPQNIDEPAIRVRHGSPVVRSDVLSVFYTRVGDAPERVLVQQYQLGEDTATWRLRGASYEVLRPDNDEGGKEPVVPSEGGIIRRPVNQLRDPYVFVDDSGLFLFYAIAGESGIAVARLEGL